MKKIFIFLAADYGNMGDVAITFAQSQIIQKYFTDYVIIEIPVSKTIEELKTIRKICQPNDIITIIGGGNMGSMYYGFEILRELIIRKFMRNKIISFHQTIDFSDTRRGRQALSLAIKAYSKHPQLTILAREKKSQSDMQKYFSNNKVILTPDVVLTLDYLQLSKKRNGVVVCMRNDDEKFLKEQQYNQLITFIKNKYTNVTYYDTHIGRNDLNEEEKKNELNKLLNTFSSAQLILTDRLHGMIFSYITGTPAIVFPNGNFKVEKSFEWIKDCGYIKFSKQTDITRLDNLMAIIMDAKIDVEKFQKKQKYFEKLIYESFYI